MRPHDDFARERAKRDGLASSCRSCNAARSERWRHENRARKRAANQAWAAANPDVDRAAKRAYARRAAVAHDPTAIEFAAALRSDPCAYCGGPSTDIDHIDPVSQGGERGAWDNLTAACRSCNARKHTKPLLRALLSMKEAA